MATLAGLFCTCVCVSLSPQDANTERPFSHSSHVTQRTPRMCRGWMTSGWPGERTAVGLGRLARLRSSIYGRPSRLGTRDFGHVALAWRCRICTQSQNLGSAGIRYLSRPQSTPSEQAHGKIQLRSATCGSGGPYSRPKREWELLILQARGLMSSHPIDQRAINLHCFTLASVARGPHFQLSFQAIPTCALNLNPKPSAPPEGQNSCRS